MESKHMALNGWFMRSNRTLATLGTLLVFSGIALSPAFAQPASPSNLPSKDSSDTRPSDIYRQVIELRHRELLKRLGEEEKTPLSVPKKSSVPRLEVRAGKPKTPEPLFRLVALYGKKAIVEYKGTHRIVRPESRLGRYRVTEIRADSIVLVPGTREVRFVKRLGPVGIFRYRGRNLARAVGDTIGPWAVTGLSMTSATLKDGSDERVLREGESERPGKAVVLTLNGVRDSRFTDGDFPHVPFSVREIHGRHALLSFGDQSIEAGIGSGLGRWKILSIDEKTGVGVEDEITGERFYLSGSSSPGFPSADTGITGSPGYPGSVPGPIPNPGTPTVPPGGAGSPVLGTPQPPPTQPTGGPQLPGY